MKSVGMINNGKLYSTKEKTERGEWQFLPRLKSWVSLPHDYEKKPRLTNTTNRRRKHSIQPTLQTKQKKQKRTKQRTNTNTNTTTTMIDYIQGIINGITSAIGYFIVQIYLIPHWNKIHQKTEKVIEIIKEK